MKSVLSYFSNLYKDKGQIILLSWCYSAIAIVFVVIAGFCALVNQSFGVAMLIIPLIAVVALCMNIVMWSLIRFALDVITRRFNKSEKKNTTKKR
jgi:Kef-type K+ transport system membrane component KefB